MKIYNKFVETKKEPSNKNDIWFDGSSWNMYKEGMWRPFTITLEEAKILCNQITNILLKLNTIEQKLNEITTND